MRFFALDSSFSIAKEVASISKTISSILVFFFFFSHHGVIPLIYY
jgi:hypothetical protein